MKKDTLNTLVIGTGILAVVLLFVAYSLPSSRENKAIPAAVASLLTVMQDFHDFGEIDIFGGKVHTTYTLRNEGDEDVTILSAVTSCMCTEGKIGDLVFGMHDSTGQTVTIPAGKSMALIATFDPLAHGPDAVGKVKRELMLKTNSTLTPEIKVSFAGNVVKKANL